METEQKNQFELSQDFSADVASLYKAWTDAEQLKQWWHPNGNSLENVINELQEGGKVEYHFKEAGLRVSGDYKEVVPNEKLVYSWNWELDDPATQRTDYVLTIKFEAKDNGSTLHVLQEGFTKQEEIIPHQEGWEKGLQSLNEFLQQGSASGESRQDNDVSQSNEAPQGNASGEVHQGDLDTAPGMEDRSGGYNELPEQAKVGGG